MPYLQILDLIKNFSWTFGNKFNSFEWIDIQIVISLSEIE